MHIQCLQAAIDAAFEYFGLEKYLTPDDIPRLDENSMLIYISEYYYGIGQQRCAHVTERPESCNVAEYYGLTSSLGS